MVDTGPLATVEMGWDEKIIFMQIGGKYDLTILVGGGSGKLGLCGGMYCCSRGLMGAPMGPGG